LDDGLSKFLGRLYEAVHDRDGWRTAIAEVLRRTDSWMFIVSSVDLRRKEHSEIQFHGPQDSSVATGVGEYIEEMAAHDPTLNFAHENPDAGTFVSTQSTPPGEYFDQPFIKWSRSRFGSTYWRSFYARPVDDLSFAVSFHRHPDAGPPTSDQMPLQALLFENLERAVRLAARPPNFADDDTALIAIDPRGRILSLSRRAEEIVAASDRLTISGGFLGAPDAEDDRLLRRAIRAAIDPSSDERPGRGVRIKRHGGKSDMLVVVSRIPPWLDHLPAPSPAAIVRLVELAAGSEHLREHSHMFELSHQETNVASALLEGHSIDSLAAALGIARNTARNHVTALFRKTETNRQSDLMRVLDRIARN
jgi:DNA-binding CsgD family transcriptional regulator